MPSLTRQINVIGRCASMYRAEQLKDTDLGPIHHSYILAVCNNPGISQDALAKHICINRSNVTRQLTYLEEKGYVERRTSETDRRVLLVYPTDKATESLPRIREMLKVWNEYLTEGFSADELDQLHEMLGRIADRAKAYVENQGGAE